MKVYQARRQREGIRPSSARVGRGTARREASMPEHNHLAKFEQAVLPHLDAAYNLARWLMRNDQDAEDVVQEACLRALRFFGGFRGGNERSWLLKILPNTSYNQLKRYRVQEAGEEFDENMFGPDPHALNPEKVLLQNASGKILRQALEELPPNFREVRVYQPAALGYFTAGAAPISVPARVSLGFIQKARMAPNRRRPMLPRNGRSQLFVRWITYPATSGETAAARAEPTVLKPLAEPGDPGPKGQGPAQNRPEVKS